ncbi:MAG TPA: RNA methyltransferase [Salinarimonas sp.]|nr:RNA methyltransferase [Salinarimonas sp.]
MSRPATPAIILVEPQLGENIGMTARAMANFGLSELRLVAPRDGWPNEKALAAAAGATAVVERACVFPDARSAVGDLRFVLATTARERGQMKRVVSPEAAMGEIRPRLAAGEGIGILFGRERTGLENDEISLADAIVTFPVDPALASLNLAQAVLLVAYEWFKGAGGGLPFGGEVRSPPAPREMVASLFDFLEAELEAVSFYPPDKRPVMTRNMRDMILRMGMSEQDVRTLRGALRALVEGRRTRRSMGG